MQTLLQIRVDESIQQESYGVSLPLLTAYCQTRTVVCAIRPATLEATTSQQLKMQQKTILRDCVKKTFYFGTNFV